MPGYKIFSLALTVALAACGPAVSSGRFSDMPLPPTSGDIVIYSTKVPTCSYEEIGLITVHRRHGFTTLQPMIDAMRERARGMGAHAVVGVALAPQVSGSVTGENNVSVSTDNGLSGTAVRFTDASCRD